MCDKWHINVIAVTKLQEIYHSNMVWSCRRGVNFALISHLSDFLRQFFLQVIKHLSIFHFSFRLQNTYGLCFDRLTIFAMNDYITFLTEIYRIDDICIAIERNATVGKNGRKLNIGQMNNDTPIKVRLR